MPMKKRLLLFTIACIISSLILSCHSSRKSVAAKSSKQPKFIDNVYIAPHNKSNATADAIAPRKPSEKAKPVASVGKTIYPASYKSQTEGDEELPKFIRKKYADILGVKPKEITNYPLFEFIDKWYGTNYRLGGCDKNGIDCSGFVQKLYAEVYGVDLVRTAIDQFSSCKRIKHSRDAEEGDLVFFRIRGKRISHVGIYLANDYFIHASTSNGVMISSLSEEYYHAHYAGCGRVPKGEYKSKS